MTTALVTKETLQQMIDNASPEKQIHIIGRALYALFLRQTESEKESNDTNQDNGVGFAGCDARSGTLTAKSYAKRHTLEGWQVEKWTSKGTNGFSRISKYAKQLNEIAIEKQKGKLL